MSGLQVWAIYKEVQRFYDMGLRVPDDVIMLLCDDNWGNVRRLPNAEERKRPGGWGMYYHVDYVGAPRNSKWLNVTPIQNMWEQLQLTYDYGVDKLWILNVGDLKPMEYPLLCFWIWLGIRNGIRQITCWSIRVVFVPDSLEKNRQMKLRVFSTFIANTMGV